MKKFQPRALLISINKILLPHSYCNLIDKVKTIKIPFYIDRSFRLLNLIDARIVEVTHLEENL